MTPILGTIASSYLQSTTAYHSIATTTLNGSSASSITFSSIPSTYSHLQLRIVSRVTQATANQNFYLRFNSDTAANYAWQRVYGSGSAATADSGASQTYILLDRTAGASLASQISGATVTDILDYTSTAKYKMSRTLGGVDSNGAGYIMFNGGAWFSTSAITSLTISTAANDFTTYTQVALYGMKTV